MKMKKLIIAASSLLAVSTLAGCSGADDLVDRDYVLGNPGTLAAGYTSLANQHANGAIDAEGYYTAGGQKFKVKDTYKTTYATEPDKDFMNYLCNTWTYNSYHYTNMVDGLVENDKYGNIVGALALGYKVTENADGSETWSFQLRENGEWVNNKSGKKVADVTAEDFVTAAKYVLDPANGSGTSSLLTGFIKGAAAYNKALGNHEKDASNPAPDFASVGVKAPSKYVVEYTLIEPTPFFDSLLTYSPYLPVNAAFLEERGTDFGKTVNDILVNGSFRITTHDYENKMVYSKNFHYYDRDHVYVNHVERKFVPGTATLDTTRTWFEAGTIDSFTVQEQDEEGWTKYVAGADGKGTLKNPSASNCNSIQSYGDATYIGYFNYNRTFYEFSSDAHETTAAERKATAEAILNTNFRKGILYGLDVIQYLKRFSTTEPQNYLMRGYTNKELNSFEGKDYTDYVNDKYNEENDTDISLIGIDNGSDPIYNATKAHEFFAAAKTELAAAGVTGPIYIDYLGSMNAQNQAFEKAMLKTVEDNATFDGEKFLIINYNVPSSSDENTKWGSINSNFDFSMWSGWGPDYADPNTYLHTMAIYGDMVNYMGFPTNENDLAEWELGEYVPQRYQDLVTVTGSGDDKDYSAAIKQLQEDVLGDYNELYEAAAAITDPSKKDERFEAFAEAEYALIYELGIVVPWYSQNGYYASVSKTIPWQAGRATYGLTSDKFKNVIVIEEAITQDQRKAVTDEYDAGK